MGGSGIRGGELSGVGCSAFGKEGAGVDGEGLGTLLGRCRRRIS